MYVCMRVHACMCACVYHTLRKIGEKESIDKPTYCFTHSACVRACMCARA